MYANKLAVALYMSRQTESTRYPHDWETFRDRVALETIYPVYPDSIPEVTSFVIDGIKVIRKIEYTTARAPVNVGTVGHVDWSKPLV